jgi:hypothetical protein
MGRLLWEGAPWCWEDWRAGAARRFSRGPLRLDAGAFVVPLSRLVSMAVEGSHGNRGLLP